MASARLIEQLKEKKQKVKELSVTIGVYAMKPVSRELKAKEEELKARLRYRLAELELEGLNIKIRIMQELVRLLHEESKKTLISNHQ